MGFYPRTHAVFGAMADKDIPRLLSRIAGLVDGWHLCTLASPRSATAESLVPLAAAAAQGRIGGQPAVHTHADPAAALAAAVAAADPADRIVVFGSFYTVGGVLKAGLPRLGAPHAASPPAAAAAG